MRSRTIRSLLTLGALTLGCTSTPQTPASSEEAASAVSAEPLAPKYAAHAVPLSRDSDYLRAAAAPDFWALLPYYAGQRDDVSCSLATLTMVVNAARRDFPQGADDRLVTQAALYERVNSPVWETGLAPDGEGVTLDELAVLAASSLRAYRVDVLGIRTVHIAEASEAALGELRRQLEQNEANPDDWVILNFLAERFVGTGKYGHFAPVAAYDAQRRRVLVLDPDREYYEPYWVPDTVALSGMATPDAVTGRPRGYLVISARGTPE